jgi:hypothetical protein
LGVAYDDRGGFTGWRKTLDHLARNGWFVVEKDNQFWRVGKGPRLLAVDEAAA